MAQITNTIDQRKIDLLEAEIKQLTTIRNNLPREKWSYVEQQLALRRGEISEIKQKAHELREEAKRKMMKAIMICDYITDVAEEFADVARRMTYSDDAGKAFRDMAKACSDRHNICMREWNEVVQMMDVKGRKVSEQYIDIYDQFHEEFDPIVNEFIERLSKTKFFDRL